MNKKLAEWIRLQQFPSRLEDKKKLFAYIAEALEPHRKYSEAEINAVLRKFYDDEAFVRRELINFGFLDRTPDCTLYWKRNL